MIFKIILGLFFLINTVESFNNYDKSKESDQKEYATNQQPDTQKVLWNFVDVVKEVKDRTVCVVAVRTSSDEEEELAKRFANTPLEEFFKNFFDKDKVKREHVAGSGFFIKVDSDAAYIVTNNHIIENVTNAKILLNDKTEIPAVVHGTDPRSDLAVLKIDMHKVPESKRSMIQPMEWGDSDQKEVGEWVLAIGNPFGLGNTVTEGIISAKSRDLGAGGGNTFNDDFIQHSAQINMGNSGGCLIDAEGRVIGVNTMFMACAGGSVGISFAIPSKIAKNVITQLIAKRKIQRGALGIQVQDFTPEMAESLGVKKYKSGAVIAFLDPKGPAAKAKLQVGDVIVKFDNTEVTSASKLSRAVGDANVATEHEITVIRNRQEKTFKVVLGDFDEINKTKKPGDTNKKMISILGMSLIDAQDANEKMLPQSGYSDEEIRGALVVNVNPNSSAGELGLMGGDIIEEVNQQPILSAQNFVDAVKESRKQKQKSIYIRVKRDRAVRFLSLKTDEDENAVNEIKEDKSQSRDEHSSKEESQASPDQEVPKKEEDHPDSFERREKGQTFDWFRNFEGFMKKFESLMKNFGRKWETVEQNNKRIYK